MSLVALPANGAPARGTASINASQQNPLSGLTNIPFEVTITNTPGGVAIPTSLNYVEIRPPASLFTPICCSIDPATGWTEKVIMNPSAGINRVIYQTTDSTKAIRPGQSMPFTVVADVLPVGCDIAGSWTVGVSDDGGKTMTNEAPASSGALTTTTRVLKVTSVAETAPVRAVDNTVTSGQNNTVTTERVLNNGNQSVTVTPALAKSAGSSTATLTAPAATTVAPGTEAVFNFPTTFGAAGDITFRGTAAGTTVNCGPSTALEALSQPITIETAVALTYVNNSITPTGVAVGAPIGFKINVNKTGDPEFAINNAQTTFSFTNYSVTLKTPTAPLPRGATPMGGTLLEFNAAAIPSIGTLDFKNETPSVTINGIDANDFPYATTLVPNNIVIDAVGPIITSTLTPPASSVPGETPAATHGSSLTVAGQIRHRGADCGACTITSAVLRQLNAAGQPISGVNDQPVTITKSTTGALSGSVSIANYNSAAAQVVLIITAARSGLSSVPTESNRVPVDITPPTLSIGRTGDAAGQDLNTLRVTFSEKVAVGTAMAPSDWAVLLNGPGGGKSVAVTSAKLDEGTTGNYGRVAILTVQPAVGRNDTGTVTYNPNPTTLAFDRVHQNVPIPASASLVDGIIPLLPSLVTVTNTSGAFPKQGAAFYTNLQNPSIAVANYIGGDVVRIYRDTNANNVIDGTDVLLNPPGNGQQTDGTIVVTPSVGLAGDGNYTILSRFQDGNGNFGPTSVDALVLDTLAPLATTVAKDASDGQKINVAFNEDLARGRDYASDWLVIKNVGGQNVSYIVGSVTGSGPGRVLNMSDDAYNPSLPLTRAAYNYTGDVVADRYQDKAGNSLADFSLNF
jgi:hypothetical protein